LTVEYIEVFALQDLRLVQALKNSVMCKRVYLRVAAKYKRAKGHSGNEQLWKIGRNNNLEFKVEA
jgi:hypothetical protein